MRWRCDIRPLSQIEVVVSPRVVVVISIYLHWFRTGSIQYHPKEWGGPPLKSIEVVVVLNFLCWLIKACIPQPPKE